MGWPIVPDGLGDLLIRLSRDYPGVPLVVTENGAAFHDVPDADGRVRDDARIQYLDGHLRAAHAALTAGADLRGISYGRFWTISSGPRATARGSGSSTSTTPTSAASRRTAHTGSVTSSPATDSGRAGMKRPTLEAVAARAGVSRATVSRVVNGSSTVNPDIRTTVLRAVEELGYVPNSAARSLVTQRTGSIGLVVSEPPARVFSDDPFFSQVIRTVSQELEAADRQVVLMMPSSPGGQARVERYVAGGHVDGVILLSLHGSDPLPAALMRTGVPVVSHGYRCPRPGRRTATSTT